MSIETLAVVRKSLSEYVKRAAEHDPTVISVHGKPTAILLSVDDYESIQETLEILGDRELMTGIRTGLEEQAAGKGIPLDQAITMVDAGIDPE